MDKQLKLFERNENTRLLTSSMINNYVKDNVLERPEQKILERTSCHADYNMHVKASFVHSRYFSIIKILNRTILQKTELNDQFRITQAKVLEDICSRVSQTAEKGKDALTKLALELSIEANARRTAAERILSELAEEEAPKHNKKES